MTVPGATSQLLACFCWALIITSTGGDDTFRDILPIGYGRGLGTSFPLACISVGLKSSSAFNGLSGFSSCFISFSGSSTTLATPNTSDLEHSKPRLAVQVLQR